MQAFHTNLVPVPANPIHPLLRRIIEPPWAQAGMLRKIYDWHVRTTSAITCWMAFLISWTENLIGVEMTCGRSWLHAEIEFPVHSTFPATRTAIQLTGHIEAAIDLTGSLLVASLWTNTAIDCNQSAAISVWFCCLIDHQHCFGIQAFKLKCNTREFFLAEHAVVVVVKRNEKRL